MPRKTHRAGEVQAGVIGRASMRPRPDAAENAVQEDRGVLRRPGFNEAAARCRGKHPWRLGGDPGTWASMRPRPDAAENSHLLRSIPLDDCGFNEAAARCRGKPTTAAFWSSESSLLQ